MFVIPAKAGIQYELNWTPACAGVTVRKVSYRLILAKNAFARIKTQFISQSQGDNHMTTTASATTAAPAPHRPWWLTLIGGVLAIIVGALLLWGNLVTQIQTYLLLVEVLGIWWLVDGIFDIVSLFVDRTAWGWKLFMGIVSIIAGGYILMYPILVGLALPQLFVLILGLWGVVKGIVLIIMAFQGGGWGAGILGAITLIFGGILIANYGVPGWGLSLVWAAAVLAFIGGFVMVFRAFQQRKA